MAKTKAQIEYLEKLKRNISYDLLYKLYIQDSLPIVKIANELNITYCAVEKLIKEYELKREISKVRSTSLKRLNKENRRGPSYYKEIITKEDLYNYYIIENHNYYETMSYFNLNEDNFRYLLKEYNIKKDKHISCKKGMDTKYEKYGGKENYINIMKNKQNETIIQRYGSLENYNKLKSDLNIKAWEKEHDEILAKMNATKKENNTFNISQVEEQYYIYLTNVYGKENVIRQYNDKRYPFNCDFYIPSKDLFIELNLTWTHGNHPFNPESEEDQNLLNYWIEKAKESDFYKNAIYTWTDLDVRKKEYIEKNKLNILIYYNLKELENDEWRFKKVR